MAAQQAAPDDRGEARPEQPEAMREPSRRHACRDRESSEHRQTLADRNHPFRTGVLWTRRRFGPHREDPKLWRERPEEHGQEKNAVRPREDDERWHIATVYTLRLFEPDPCVVPAVCRRAN